MENRNARNKLTKYVEDFLEECKERSLSPNTIKAYRLNLRQFCAFLEDRGGDITEDNVVTFLSCLRERLKPASVNQMIAAISLFMDYLCENSVISENPVKKLNIRQKKQETQVQTVGMNVITAILQSAYHHKERCKPGSYSYLTTIRDIAVLELLFISGMRVSELCRLSPFDVNLKEKTVYIRGAGNKSRYLQIENEDTMRALSEYQKEFLVKMMSSYQYFVNRRGTGLSEQSVRNIISRYAKSAYVEEKITPRILRDSLATLLAEEGTDLVSLQHILGHGSIAQMQRYVKTDKESRNTKSLRDTMRIVK